MNAVPIKANPKYRQVLDSLQQELTSGRYTDGQKMPSEADLVKRFGASRITIGRAMRELQTLDLIERRAGSGTYARTAISSGLTFGLLIPNLGQTEIFEPICQGMADAAQRGRHALLWGNAVDAGPAGEQALDLCRQYIERKVSGVFFAPLELTANSEAINRQIIAALDEARIPVVLLDRGYLPYPERDGHDLVGIDNRRVGFLAAEHLLAQGARRIGFVARPHSAGTVEARIAGYREALFRRGLPLEARLVRQFDAADREATQRFMEKEKPDAIVCANDHTAGDLMHSLLALGFKIPADVRLMGIDDLRFARVLPVPLTTVRQPTRDIGVVAMGVMLDRLKQPRLPARDVLLASQLIVRESCGPADGSSRAAGNTRQG